VAGGPLLFSNVAFGEATSYVDAGPGTVNLEARIAGTDDIVLGIPDVVLAVGTVYTFGAVGLLGGVPPLGAMPLIDS
jgi:hypothetical protein